jgi:putative two-component system response regulator
VKTTTDRLLRVLIVEDSQDDTTLLLAELRRGGYEPVHAQVDTADALRSALERQSWDVVLSDHALPRFDSLAALRLLKTSELDIPFIIVSGTIGEERAVEAMKAGASDYVMKGKLARLVPAVARELAEAKQRAARSAAEQALREREQQTILELNAAYNVALEGWARALDLRDHETEGHCRRVADVAVRLAAQMGMSEADCVHVRRGALLHDIGKMGIPDRILLKPSALSPDEWEIMRRHPTYALELLGPIAYLGPAIDIPYCHHEKWDGTGYPRGLKGEQIPLAARVFAIADIWDAVRSDRPYRPAWSVERAREHVLSLAGSHLDPQVVSAFMKMSEMSEPVSPPSGSITAPGARQTGTTILVVDDLPANRDLLARWLVSEGYDVRTAESGESALAAVAQRHPDLILLDIGIPRPDGCTVCQRLKQSAATQHMPIILMTGEGRAAHEVRARDLRADGYFTKPFDLGVLSAHIHRVLEGRRTVAAERLDDPGQ